MDATHWGGGRSSNAVGQDDLDSYGDHTETRITTAIGSGTPTSHPVTAPTQQGGVVHAEGLEDRSSYGFITQHMIVATG
ncbi:Uu.00g084000.m01.CDS01 [Anthostomella pinea]|uniref:Uu.00g084000.m01.CDS01 n=1 Tax=Anthostomella pinea TaxID=933095 RepID=A0AAI8YH93_9PEZI|nr:Uu.00g084000.m01.CDS01 [Anthostomella pinea]